LPILNDDLPEIRKFNGHDWFSTKTYHRNLPHWELKGSTYTICVDSQVGKPFCDLHAAKFMISSLSCHHKKMYLLHAYVVMPDHLHFIIKPILNNSLSQIMKILKGSTAYNINKILNRTGKFWQTKLVDKAENYPFSSFYINAG